MNLEKGVEMPVWLVIAAMISLFGLIVGAYVFVIKYTAAKLKEKVDDNVFVEVRKSDDKDHKYLNDCIEREARLSGQRFDELKKAMESGFTKVDGNICRIFKRLER